MWHEISSLQTHFININEKCLLLATEATSFPGYVFWLWFVLLNIETVIADLSFTWHQTSYSQIYGASWVSYEVEIKYESNIQM